MPSLRVLTWNLQGGRGADLKFIGEELASWAPDVVALQEVQRRQAQRLGEQLEWHERWAFKHAPIVRRSEGLAILSRHELAASETLVLQPALLTSARRRIALIVRVRLPGRLITVASVHLSHHERAAARLTEVNRFIEHIRTVDRDVVVAGDFNEQPPSNVIARLEQNGWADSWSTAEARVGDGMTNWSPGSRIGRGPDQRIDYVLVARAIRVVRALIPTSRHQEFAPISDHLPLLVTLDLP